MANDSDNDNDNDNDNEDNNMSNNNSYRRMLEKQLKDRSLDDLLAGNIGTPPPIEGISNQKINHLIIKPVGTHIKKTPEVLPELPSEFERILLFSSPFDDWKHYGQSALVKLSNILYTCSEENNPVTIFTGRFEKYIGYGRGALVGNWKKHNGLQYDDSAYLCPLPPAEPFHIRFPNDREVFPLGRLTCWQPYAEGIIGIVHKFASYCLTKYSDKKTIEVLTKIPDSQNEIELFSSGEGAIVRTGTRFMRYSEANREGIELYRGGWSKVFSWGDDLIVCIGDKIIRYSERKESKLLYQREESVKMTGCGLLITGADGRLNLRTDEGENVSFKGDINKIVGYPLGMLIEDEAKRLWAIRRKRD